MEDRDDSNPATLREDQREREREGVDGRRAARLEKYRHIRDYLFSSNAQGRQFLTVRRNEARHNVKTARAASRLPIN